MMKIQTLVLVGVVVAALSACQDAPTTGPETSATRSPARGLSVMTWNVYYGTDLNAVVAALADPDIDDLAAFGAALQTLETTSWLDRVEAIADAIAEHRPHAVGLQEIATFDIDLTAYGIDVDFTLPFLPILQQALANRGVAYTVAGVVESFHAQPIPGISVQDFNVLLVDASRVEVIAADADRFVAGIGPVAPGVALYDGWVVAHVDVGQNTYTVANTHFTAGEGAQLSGLRFLQAQELLGALGNPDAAVILGDLNDVVGSPMYQAFAGAGFTDVWAALRPGDDGFTCCQQADLSNDVSQASARIDYVLARGMGHPRTGLGRSAISLVGADPSERIDGPYWPLWPSDHAGLVAAFMTPPANGQR